MIETPDKKPGVADSMPPDIDRLAQYFVDAFPAMTVTEQRLALKLYRLLSEGEAVAYERLSGAADIALTEVETIVQHWPGVFHNDDHQITGFWGLSINETKHRIDVNGKTVYTWCAWDTLFIPELLNATAQVTSNCALSGDEITLCISPEAIESSRPDQIPDQIRVSFLIPDEAAFRENITASFCHHVFFLRSVEAGECWLATHPGTFLLSLDEAFAIGKKMNAARYKLVQINQ